MNVCFVNVIYVDLDMGVKIINNLSCVGCYFCMIVCFFGIVFMFLENDKVVKCDFCGGDFVCVIFCLIDVIMFVEIDFLGEWFELWGVEVN